jgi:hypothetical protein
MLFIQKDKMGTTRWTPEEDDACQVATYEWTHTSGASCQISVVKVMGKTFAVRSEVRNGKMGACPIRDCPCPLCVRAHAMNALLTNHMCPPIPCAQVLNTHGLKNSSIVNTVLARKRKDEYDARDVTSAHTIFSRLARRGACDPGARTIQLIDLNLAIEVLERGRVPDSRISDFERLQDPIGEDI